MLPEQIKPETSIKKYSGQEVNETLLGGEATILPRYHGKTVEGYDVTLTTKTGSSTFPLNVRQGQELIAARLAAMTRIMVDVDQEAFDSLVPTIVAEKYKDRLISMGTPEDQIPKTTEEMIMRAKGELIAFQELGVQQIASKAQSIADEVLEIVYEVYKGNNIRYNGLPSHFKESVDFMIPSINALAAQHAGITDETIAAQKKVLALNLLSHEKTREAILDWFPAMAGAGADTIATFFGKLIGTTGGAVAGSYSLAKEAIKKRK